MSASIRRAHTAPSTPQNLLRLTLPALALLLTACSSGGGGGGVSTAPTNAPDAYEEDDAPSLAKTIAVNSFQNRNHYDDVDDWIKFDAIAGYQYTITTSNLSTYADTTLDLYNSSMSWLAYNDDYSTGYASQIVWTAPSSGTYYIDAAELGVSTLVSGQATNYTISITAQAAPPQPDLAMASMSVPTSVAANGVLTFSDSVTNQGTGDAGGFYVDYYLSTNTAISTSDTYLGSRRISALATGATDTATSSFAVPGSLTQGSTYYVGALIDTSYEVSELDESNNTSSANALTIDPPLPADLTVSSVTATASVPAGTAITVGDTVSNSGYTASGVSVYYYLSADATITATDTYIGSRTISSIDTVDDVNNGLDITLPRDFTPGSYYLGAIVDPLNTVLENNDTDNTSNAVAVTVTAALPSDLVFSSFTPDTVVNTYNQIAITDTVSNQGSGDENSFNVSYYLSTDNIVDGTDTLLGTRTIASLAASASDTGTVNFSINRSVGTYYVYAVIDTAGQALETDTTNNTSLVATISVVNPDVAMSTFTVSPTTVQIGDTITITDSVTNLGSANITDSFTVSYYLSADYTVNTSDTYLGSRTIYGLAAGATNAATITKTIPTSLTANGTYYIAAIVDPYNYLYDGDTTNNSSSQVAMSISGACTADAYEEDDSYATATAIGVGTTQSHNFCLDSSDWLSFSAVAGNSYSISTSTADNYNPDTYLYLYSTDGTTQLLYNDDGGPGWDALISSWTAPATGIYYIRVGSYSSGNLTDYSVTLSTP